jgi:hypothetical protein
MQTYECDACGAVFDFEARNIPGQEIPFCPECGESEIIKVLDEACSCGCEEEHAEAVPHRG